MRKITLPPIFFAVVVVCSSIALFILPGPDDETKKEKEAGPELEIKYFEYLHYPYGAVLEPEMINNIWNDVKKVKREQELFIPLTTWTAIGPYGSVIPSNGVRFTGRVIDINVRDTGSVKIAAASGGLWAPGNPNPVPLTEQITSQAAGSFDIQPGSSNVIILGTGEPHMRGGTGLFRTSDGGASWTNISMSDTTPSTFYKIRFSSQTVVHAASDRGYYRSQDNGLTWTRHLRGDISDVAVNPVNTNTLYCARWQRIDTDSGGVYKSTDGGNSWTRMTGGSIPIADVGRTSISICEGNPNFVYVLMSKRDNNMKGVYRTAGGDFWVTASPGEDILDGQGWYNNEIGVCPTSSGIVLAGGIYLWRTSNFGVTWSKVTDLNVHVDQHAITWNSSGTSVWVGNDGGVCFSDDRGQTFNTSNNRYPITQYYNVDVSLSNPNVVMGGSQDNGITSTTDGGTTWRYNISWGGDGSGVAINPFNPAEFYMTIGVYGDNWPFKPNRSTDYGQSWTVINNGIDASNQWFTRIKTDNISPINVYTGSSRFLYYSTNMGNNWLKRNTSAAFADWVSNFSVRKYSDTTITYVCTFSRYPGERIYVQTGSGSFVERSADINDGLNIGAIGMHQNNSNVAYAVITGLYSAHKVYRTTNRGINWTNITSNLPNVSATDIAVNPYSDSTLYLGTEMGCFKTTDRGGSWFRWNDGLPEAAIISQMKTYTTSEGLFVLAGTYGRSVWTRREDSPVSIGNISGIPNEFKLHQNYPNPFNPVTTIKMSLAIDDDVQLYVYDIAGRLTATILNTHMKAGIYDIKFDGTNLSSGVYFYKINTSRFTDVKKMVLVK